MTAPRAHSLPAGLPPSGRAVTRCVEAGDRGTSLTGMSPFELRQRHGEKAAILHHEAASACLIQSFARMFVLLVLLSFSSTSVFAHPDDGCYAGDEPLCSPSSDACAYRAYAADGTFTEDADADGDGWQDGCDAFPTETSEWADLDGDDAGHNADCNDLDSGLRECEPLGSDEATASPETADDIQGSASPIFDKNTRMLRPVPCHPHWECGEWSACVDGVMTRVCRDAWACRTDEDKPDTQEACGTVSEPVPMARAEPESRADLPGPGVSPPHDGSMQPQVPSESWALLIGATVVLVLLGIFRKRHA